MNLKRKSQQQYQSTNLHPVRPMSVVFNAVKPGDQALLMHAGTSQDDTVYKKGLLGYSGHQVSRTSLFLQRSKMRNKSSVVRNENQLINAIRYMNLDKTQQFPSGIFEDGFDVQGSRDDAGRSSSQFTKLRDHRANSIGAQELNAKKAYKKMQQHIYGVNESQNTETDPGVSYKDTSSKDLINI